MNLYKTQECLYMYLTKQTTTLQASDITGLKLFVCFFLLDAAWVKSLAERPSVSYTKVTAKSQGQAIACNYTNQIQTN